VDHAPPPTWELRPAAADPSVRSALQAATGLSSRTAEILLRRGLHDPAAARSFLEPSFSQLLDPAPLLDVERAVELLTGALARGERIALHGDYDVDGMAATALLAGFLRQAGGQVVSYLPERDQDGYGLSLRGVRLAAQAEATVLVALDCGTSDHEAITLAHELGLVPLVVDHHLPAGPLPTHAAAVLNPARPGCGFAGGTLSATGVAFHLAIALRRSLRERGWFVQLGRPEPNLRSFLDLVALGTVADMVPLVGPNRTCVAFGLTELTRRRRPGLAALCAVAGVGEQVTATDVGFKLAPRLNASGRLGSPLTGLELLGATDSGRAAVLARQLEEHNVQRRRLQEQVEQEAIELLEGQPGGRAPVAVVAKAGWHPGVVGIVASRLAERYYVPAVVIALQEGIGRGSARSVDGIDIGRAIQSCREHLLRGGGHPQAAGVTLEEHQLDGFREALGHRVEQALAGQRPSPRLLFDAEVALEELDEALAGELGRLAPFGMGNPEPVLVTRGVRLLQRRSLRGGHVQCLFGDDGVTRPAVGFGLDGRVPPEGSLVAVAGSWRKDRYRGEDTLRLFLKDVREEKECKR
jgi:single-stranded-DNA-specific exonuclease